MPVIQDLTFTLPRNPAKPYVKRALTGLTTLAIHHTAGPSSQTPEQLARFHISKGWSGIGYNFLVYPDGGIFKCRPIGVIPACVVGHNTESICVCFVGDFTEGPPTAAALSSGAWLAQQLLAAYDTIVRIRGHREIAGQSTACPGAMFPLDDFRASVGAVT